MNGLITEQSRDFSAFAVLLIDVQEDFWTKEIANAFPEFPNKVSKLLDFCRREGLDIIHLRAGFKKDELSIQLKENTLTIKGETNSKNSNGDYLHKNIARRSFSKDFTLAANIEVGEASFEDGVLSVSLTHNIPEEQRPKEISIH